MRVLVLLDRDSTGNYFRKFLQNEGHYAEWCKSAAEAMQRIRQGLGDFDVVFLHKDLGEPQQELHINSELAAGIILEDAPHVRLGLVSGEFPSGEAHVKRLMADFYCSYLDLMVFGLKQVEKGIVSEEERKLRGNRVEMPPFSIGLERYK